jgi:hypothetical protein
MVDLIVLGFYNTIVAGGIGDSPSVVREGLLEFVKTNITRQNPVFVYASIGMTEKSEPFVRSLLKETGIEDYLAGFYFGKHLKEGLFNLPALVKRYAIHLEEMVLIGSDNTTRKSAEHFGTYFIPVPSMTDEINRGYPEADFWDYLPIYKGLPFRFNLAGLDLETKSRDYLLWSEKDKA